MARHDRRRPAGAIRNRRRRPSRQSPVENTVPTRLPAPANTRQQAVCAAHPEVAQRGVAHPEPARRKVARPRPSARSLGAPLGHRQRDDAPCHGDRGGRTYGAKEATWGSVRREPSPAQPLAAVSRAKPTGLPSQTPCPWRRTPGPARVRRCPAHRAVRHRVRPSARRSG